MDSFDQSLKYLLHREPAGFIRFGLRDPSVQVLRPIESGLPSRGRDVDGGYLIARGDEHYAAHVELHRRHQSAEDLAVDVAEAQIRLFRRERVRVVSLVWDLYGTPGGPVVEERTLRYGASTGESGSEARYLRVNLRGLGWQELLTQGPPVLWPLVPLAREGASDEAVRKASEAIEGRSEMSAAVRADHLAVLWFVAEAEDVPVRLMRAYIEEQKLMASTLYQSILEKGEARGQAKVCAETIIRLLAHWMGAVEPDLRERIRTRADLDTLTSWYDDALFLRNAEDAERLAEKIRKAHLA